MLTNATNSSATNHTAVLAQPTPSSTHKSNADSPQKPVVKTALAQDDLVFQAVEQGGTEKVITHFTAWRYTILPWHYYRHAVAEVLEHAAQFPHAQTGDIVDFLLTKVAPEYVSQPKSLLKIAVKNNHSAIVTYIIQSFKKKIYEALALEAAVEHCKPEQVQLILDAGYDPYNYHIKQEAIIGYTFNGSMILIQQRQIYPYILNRVISTFEHEDDQETTNKRLAIMGILLKHLKQFKTEYLPGFTLNLCPFPEASQLKVAQLLSHMQIPTKPCSNDEKTKPKLTGTAKKWFELTGLLLNDDQK